MDRNKLLRIIQKDLQELTEITDELAGKKQISTLGIEFALGKSKIVCQEFEYLKELNQQQVLPEETILPDPLSPAEPAKEVPGPEAVNDEVADAEPRLGRDGMEEGSVEVDSMEEQDEPQQEMPFPDEQTEEEMPSPVEQTEENEEEIPLPVQETKAAKEETREADDKRPVSEIFVHERSVNDLLGPGKTIEHKLTGSPLTKLRVAIGLNDRFLFIRELFNNDATLFNETIDQLDRMESIQEAIAFLNGNFKWKKNETSLKFAQLVKRRFS